MKYKTPYGDCWRRYNHDGYGQRKDGGPFLTYGQGRAWPLLGGERAHYELAAGKDVSSFIKAFESFSSIGGMLPEQVWDHDDWPEEGLYQGRSAGSAQPLVWAHAEYLKLLRSVSEGKIFDTISVVAERYAVAPGTRSFKSTTEIFSAARPLSSVPAGFTLRIIDQNRFRVVYTVDDWTTQTEVNSRVVGYPGSYVDIAAPSEAGFIEFTLHWPATADAAERWLGKNYRLQVKVEAPETMPADTKPVS